MNRTQITFIICLALAGFLMFANLGNMYLEVDEAETAELGRRVLTFGLPMADDGRNLIQQNAIPPYKSPEHKVWIFHPWLQFYLAAASFKLLGVNNFSARFPFALVGFLSLIVFWFTLRKHVKNEPVLWIAWLMLALNVPFYLYMRQCRYYSLTLLFTLVVLDAYLDVIERDRGTWRLIAGSVLLFYSNYAALFPLMLGMGLHFLLAYTSPSLCPFPTGERGLVRIGLAVGITAALCLPGAWYLEIWRRKEVVLPQEVLTLSKFAERMTAYFLQINDYIFPAILLLIFSIATYRKWPEFWKRHKDGLPGLSIIVIFSTLVFYSLIILYDFRLIIHLLPLVLLVSAFAVSYAYARLPKFVSVPLFIILTGTNFFHSLPFEVYRIPDNQRIIATYIAFRSKYYGESRNEANAGIKGREVQLEKRAGKIVLLKDYLFELTHDYDGPMKGIVEYLSHHARPGDTVKIRYGDIPLIFYLGDKLKVTSSVYFRNDQLPDWWIFRGKHWTTRIRNAGIDLEARYGDILARKYERIEIASPELPWDNLPEPGYHKFATVKDAPRAVIYKRRR